MNILIIMNHVLTDPDRVTFYNIDGRHQYIKRGIQRVFKSKNKVFYFLNLVLTAIQLRRHYKRMNVDLIISGNPRIGFVVGAINRISFCKTAHAVWNFNVHHVYTGIKRRLSSFALKQVHYLLVYSRHEQRIYSDMLGLAPERILYKYYSGPYLEDKRYQSLKSAGGEEYVVSAGFSGRDYAFLAAVAEQMPDVTFFVLTYPSVLKNISFGSNVKVISGIPEVEYCRYIANAKLFFLPMKNKETANGHIAIVQAMCLRTPLLTNMTEGTKDYLQPDINSVIFPDGDVKSTAVLVRKIWTDREWSEKIVNQAYQFARERFTIQKEIEAVEQIAASTGGRR